MTYEEVKDVKYFFTEEQWTRMGEYERNICRNQLEFYKFKKLNLGIEPEKTGYMKHYEKRLAEEEKARQKEARNQAKSKNMAQMNVEAGPSTSKGGSKSNMQEQELQAELLEPGFNSDEALLRQPVEIYCRIRPIDEAEERCIRVLDDKTLEIAPPGGSLAVRSQKQNAKAMQYTFTKVFEETADQKEVFDQTAKSLVSELLKGRNGLLFAYGNTGSGKTHTMTGHNKNGGLLPRSVDVLFNSISMYLARPNTFKSDKMNCFDVLSPPDALVETSKDRVEKAQQKVPSRNWQDAYESKESRTEDLSILSGVDSDCLYAVFVTYVEVYNNSVFDLLESQSTDSRAKAHFQTKALREDSSRRMYFHNATQLEVMNADEALEAFKHGQKRRRVAQTTLNAESSRSHSVFTIRLVQVHKNCVPDEVVDKNTMTVSQLSLVDLDGFERTSRTNTKGDRLKEAGNINNTLMTLHNCIKIYRENQLSGTNKIVPYRDSKITHIFKSYFEGEGKMKMVVCVNPRAEDFDETVEELKNLDLSSPLPSLSLTIYNKTPSKKPMTPKKEKIPSSPAPTPSPVMPVRKVLPKKIKLESIAEYIVELDDDVKIPKKKKKIAPVNDSREQIERISREEHANSDQNVVFSLGTFPPHELFRNADIQEILTNLESYLQHRIDTRSQLSANIMSRRADFRNRLIALDNDSPEAVPEEDSPVVVLTSDEPSSSGICTQFTQQNSKAELLEELRQEKEAREKLEAFMKRQKECLDSELSCSICSEVFVKPVKLPCLHSFCQTCILQWERNQRNCPMCRAKYTRVGRADSLLVSCIEKLIESTYTQDEQIKRAELVAARGELERQLLPSTSDSGQTRGSRGRNSRQRGRGIPPTQPAHIGVATMPTTIVQPAFSHQVPRLTRMPGHRTTRGGQRPPWRS